MIKKLFGVVCIAIYIYSAPHIVSGAASPELENAIQAKAQALQEVTKKLQETSQQLLDTEERSKNLKKELDRLGKIVTQVGLSIKSSELTIEKLGLEISAAQLDISSARAQEELKKIAIAELLRVTRERDDEHALIALLNNRTISEQTIEIERISNVNETLRENIRLLGIVKEELGRKLNSASEKKVKLESTKVQLQIQKTALSEEQAGRRSLFNETKNQEYAYQKIVSDLERQQATISDDIEKIESELREKIDPTLLPKKRAGVLLKPTDGFLSQNFGATPFALRGGYRGRYHNGIDIAAPIGTPIVAAEDGKIIKIGNQDRFCRKAAYGKFIVVKHNNNLTTLYGHLSAFGEFQEGSDIKRGDVIGYVGKTGYATGPHLHFTVYSSLTFYMGGSRSCGAMPYGGVLNPSDYL